MVVKTTNILYNKYMIYLDHAAATPVKSKVIQTMLPYFDDQFFNPSSPYLPANHVRDNYEYAKSRIANAIGAKGVDIIITSGATEATNLAFTAVDVITDNKAPQATSQTQQINSSETSETLETSATPEILILATEHASVKAVASSKNAKSIEVKVDKTGLIDLDDFRHKLNENTIFVSVALVNNELGTIQPLAEIAEIIRKEHENRLETGNKTPIFLHSDASQALNCMEISVSRLGVDLLTISSAKIGGPKGVGALYKNHDVKLKPLIYGGGQELNLRSGTENVPGVIGFAVAAAEAKEHANGNRKKYEHLSKILREELQKSPIEPLFLHNKKHSLSSFVPVSFPGIDAERLIYKLEEKEVYLSTGAACAANKGTRSHVLEAIGLSDKEIEGSLRISLGDLNTENNVKKAGQLIVEAIKEELGRER